jgi:hypothetical protein
VSLICSFTDGGTRTRTFLCFLWPLTNLNENNVGTAGIRRRNNVAVAYSDSWILHVTGSIASIACTRMPSVTKCYHHGICQSWKYYIWQSVKCISILHVNKQIFSLIYIELKKIFLFCLVLSALENIGVSSLLSVIYSTFTKNQIISYIHIHYYWF